MCRPDSAVRIRIQLSKNCRQRASQRLANNQRLSGDGLRCTLIIHAPWRVAVSSSRLFGCFINKIYDNLCYHKGKMKILTISIGENIKSPWKLISVNILPI
jgi:hypothetical protein